MKTSLRTALQSLFFATFGASILFLVYRHENAAYLASCARTGIELAQCDLIAKLVNDLRDADSGWLALVLLAYLASTASRVCKWLLLLQPLGFRAHFGHTFLAICIAYFANLGLPRAGEVVRATMVSRYERIPLEQVVGTIVADRAVDLLCLGVVMALALLLEFDKISGFVAARASLPGAQSWIVVGAAGLAGSTLLLGFRKRLSATGLYRQAAGRLVGFRAGLLTVRRLQHPVWFVLHNLNIWLLSYLMTWMGLQAFAPTAGLDGRAALTVFVFATLGVVVPAPGGMGTFHFLVISALTLFYGIRGDDAFSAANIFFFAVNISFTAMLGLLSLASLPLINRRVRQTS